MIVVDRNRGENLSFINEKGGESEFGCNIHYHNERDTYMQGGE